MDKKGKYVLAGACGLVFCALTGVAGTAHAPRIATDEQVIDLGDKRFGEAVRVPVTISNEGDLTLVVEHVRACCGTSVTQLPANELRPGETGTVFASFTAWNRAGVQSRTVTVQSNCPENPRFQIALRCNGVTDVTVTPARIHFGQLGTDAVVTQMAEVVIHTPMHFKGVESSVEHFEADLETIEEGTRLRVRVVTRPPLPAGSQSGTIALVGAGGVNMAIPVSASVTGALSYAPREIVLRAREPGALTRHIVVRPGHVRDFELLGVDTPQAGMHASIMPMGGHGYRVQVDGIQPAEDLEGQELVIRTTTGEMPDIRIPFRMTP